MRFTLVAVATGLAIGVLAGGRPRHLAHRGLRLWPLLLAALGLQAVAVRLESPTGLVLLLCSYALLLAFAAGNVTLVGMWLVALGIGLNLVAIAVNGGMPVSRSALVAAGIADAHAVDAVPIEGKRHLQRPSDRLLAISDVIPVPPLREVVSFGDVAMGVGVADVLVHLLRPPRGRSRAGVASDRKRAEVAPSPAAD